MAFEKNVTTLTDTTYNIAVGREEGRVSVKTVVQIDGEAFPISYTAHRVTRRNPHSYDTTTATAPSSGIKYVFNIRHEYKSSSLVNRRIAYHTAADEMLARLEGAKLSAQTKLEVARSRLIEHMRSLAQTLEHEARKLESTPNYHINELGVVQGQGQIIDIYCASYGAAKDALKSLEFFEV